MLKNDPHPPDISSCTEIRRVLTRCILYSDLRWAERFLQLSLDEVFRDRFRRGGVESGLGERRAGSQPG